MSVDYSVYLYYGVSIKESDCKVILEPEVVEYQNRYDPKTGKKTHTEKVLVKHENSIYRLGKYESESIWELAEVICDDKKLSACVYQPSHNNLSIVVGSRLMSYNGGSSFTYPIGTESLANLQDIHNKLLNQDDIPMKETKLKLRCVSWVG